MKVKNSGDPTQDRCQAQIQECGAYSHANGTVLFCTEWLKYKVVQRRDQSGGETRALEKYR